MNEEIEKALEAEELAGEVNFAEAEKMLAEAMTGATEAPAEREPVDIEAVAQKVHRERVAENAINAARVEAEKTARFNEQTDELLNLIERAREDRRARELRTATDDVEARMQKIDAQVIQIFADDTRRVVRNPEMSAMPVKVPTMEQQNANKKKKSTGVYHVELGSTASWFIAITLLLGLIARMAGVA